MAVSVVPEQAETRVIHRLVDFASADVLDIGCGDGRMTRRFAAPTRSVVGLDPMALAVETAHADLPPAWRHKIRFLVADVTTTTLPVAAFDVVVLSYSLC
jgi:ubiquinone/menaquinone biosynthesis C-methylase UbiE